MRKVFSATAVLFAAFLVASMAGCSSGNGDPKINPDRYKSLLYMTDTFSGKIYTYDPATRAPSSLSLASVGQNSTGELVFHKGVGYACVGSGSDAGVYYFVPADANPSFTKIPGTLCAANCAFASDTKAYVSVYDYYDVSSGIHAFDPSTPASGISSSPVPGTGGDDFQELVVASDGFLYAANNSDSTVLKINVSTDEVVAVFSATALGTTGLASGTLDGASGVFVANTGGYIASPAGSIDFIPAGAADGSTAVAVASALAVGGGRIIPARLAQLPDGDLIATGYGHTYRVDLSGAAAAVTELTASDSPFGSMDLAVKDGLVFIPSSEYISSTEYANKLYIVDTSGSQQSYSPVTIMDSGDSVSNIAFYSD
jgi:hypothetical protein